VNVIQITEPRSLAPLLSFSDPEKGNLTSSQALTESILDAFPSGSYAMTGLLRLLDIVATTSVSTAAVECRVQPRMLINPAFVSAHADTSEKLLMLVMHELHHVLLGHTTLFPRVTPEQNFVFDAVINGLVCRMFPDAAFTRFFTDYYQDDRFPDCLLRPPKGWPATGFQVSPGLSELEPTLRQRAQEIHAALYSDGGASYHEVHELLPRILSKSDLDGLSKFPLLGDHEADDHQRPDLSQGSPVLFDLVRDLVEQWPQPPDPSGAPPKIPSRRSILRNLIQKVAGAAGKSPILQAHIAAIRIQSPLPTLSRRSCVLQALGVPSLLHPAEIQWKRRRHSGALVHIYLDVSGSMNDVFGPLYGATLDCEDLLHPMIHLFSTKVVDITKAELRAGRCISTGGTSIDTVAEHMSTHNIRRALIVTDGWVGRPCGQHHKTLRSAKLAVAYLGNAINRDDLADVADYTDIISTGAL
jgi:hypothetical protein